MAQYTKEEVARRGKEIYETQIRDQVEPEHLGEFIVIDVETGEYEIDADDIAVMKRAAQKHSPEKLYGMKIGSPVMGRIGARMAPVKR